MKSCKKRLLEFSEFTWGVTEKAVEWLAVAISCFGVGALAGALFGMAGLDEWGQVVVAIVTTILAFGGLQVASMRAAEKREKIAAVSDALKSKPMAHKRWCNSKACGCLGCANSAIYQAGLTKADFDLWAEAEGKT